MAYANTDLGSIQNPIVSCHLHQILFPSIDEILSEAVNSQSDPKSQRDYTKACNDLKQAFAKTEKHSPGFTSDFVKSVLPKSATNGNRNTSKDEVRKSSYEKQNGHGSHDSDTNSDQHRSLKRASKDGNGTNSSDADKKYINEIEACIRLAGIEVPEYKIDTSRSAYADLEDKAMLLKRLLCQIPDDIKLPKHEFINKIKDTAQAVHNFLLATEGIVNITIRDHKRVLEGHKKLYVVNSRNFSEKIKLYFRDCRTAPVFSAVEKLIFSINNILVAIGLIQRGGH